MTFQQLNAINHAHFLGIEVFVAKPNDDGELENIFQVYDCTDIDEVNDYLEKGYRLYVNKDGNYVDLEYWYSIQHS